MLQASRLKEMDSNSNSLGFLLSHLIGVLAFGVVFYFDIKEECEREILAFPK